MMYLHILYHMTSLRDLKERKKERNQDSGRELPDIFCFLVKDKLWSGTGKDNFTTSIPGF